MELSSLAAKAKQLQDNYQFEEAQQVYKEIFSGITKESDLESEVLDGYAELCSSLGDLTAAEQLYTKSLELFPNENPHKYHWLAQVHTGKEALTLYELGINLMKQSPNSYKTQLATAYSAVAELYITDLCDEPNAEANCENYLTKAIETDEMCLDAYQCLANLKLITQKNTQAQEAMEKFKTILEHCGFNNLPSVNLLGEAARTLVELEDYSGVLRVCEVAVSMDDTKNELIYIFAFALCKLKHYEEASELLDILTQRNLDPELSEATQELINLINK